MLFCLFLQSAWGISIKGDFSVNGKVTCDSIEADSIDTDGSVEIDSSLISDTISSTYISTESLTVSTITSPTGTLSIEGNIDLSPSTSSTFLQNNWKLTKQDTFEESHQEWSTTIRNLCGQQSYLGGDCSVNHIYKKFDLPSHSFVRIVGTLHLLDLWHGEKIEIKADGQVVWSRKGHSSTKGVNICGLEHPDPGFATKFDIMVPHSYKEILVSFESSLDQNKCHASFAIGQVNILTRI